MSPHALILTAIMTAQFEGRLPETWNETLLGFSFERA